MDNFFHAPRIINHIRFFFCFQGEPMFFRERYFIHAKRTVDNFYPLSLVGQTMAKHKGWKSGNMKKRKNIQTNYFYASQASPAPPFRSAFSQKRRKKDAKKRKKKQRSVNQKAGQTSQSVVSLIGL
ncbi:MAG: hypothetical protein IJI53_13180 [Clostridia bacterium]|nr:hypothetical protein [Clostridia bacterium]